MRMGRDGRSLSEQSDNRRPSFQGVGKAPEEEPEEQMLDPVEAEQGALTADDNSSVFPQTFGVFCVCVFFFLILSLGSET